MNFQKMRDARKAAGKSQDDLAKELGVNRATISKYETGVIEPSLAQIVHIARILDMDFGDLLDGEAYRLYKAHQSGFEAGQQAAQIDNIALKSVFESDGYTFSDAELLLVRAFSQLNPEGQQKAVERVEELTEMPKFTLRFDALTSEEKKLAETGQWQKLLDLHLGNTNNPQNKKPPQG